MLKDRVFMPGGGGGGLVPSIKENREQHSISGRGLHQVGWLPIGVIKLIRIIGHN